MDWTEIQIHIPVEAVDKASAIAHMTVPYGIYIEDYSDLEQGVLEIAHIDLIDEELLAKARDKAIIHIYISPEENPMEAVSFLKERLTQSDVTHSIDCVSVKEDDWATAWQKYYHPLHVGKNLVVCPSWEEYTPQEQDVVITLDPGMAFGTGTHETTRLCMELLERHVQPDSSVLDIGCGSGILAITGLLLGASSALGVDIDAHSIEVAKENARLNGVSGQAELLCGDLTEKVHGQYGIVCANIVADVVIRLLDTVKNYMLDDAVLLCSGIIDAREEDVVQALREHGFLITDILREKGWLAIECKAAPPSDATQLHIAADEQDCLGC